MPIKSYRPTTPTRRFQTVVSREDITKQTPEKSLVESKKRTGGRNSTGRVTSAGKVNAARAVALIDTGAGRLTCERIEGAQTPLA